MQKQQNNLMLTNVTQVLKVLKFLILKLKLEDIEFAIKNKLIHLLFESREFKFMTTLVLELKNRK